MAPYQYQPLDPEAKTIRLLRLLPGSFENDICVSLETTVLCEDSIPKYEALSYAWGSTEDPADISISPAEGRDRDMWIDAICVEQRILDERGHQVERMADIYRNAEQVVAWIGPTSDNSTLAMETLGSLGSRLEAGWDDRKISAISPDDTDLADCDLPIPYGDENWNSLGSFMNRKWFKRLWVWQEMLLAKSANLQCGYSSIGWSDFRKAIRCISLKRHLLDRDLLNHIDSFICTEALSYALEDLVHETYQCECSDPRDRIYALLNIVYQQDSVVGLRPDYTQTPIRTFQDVVLRALSHKGELDLMRHCEWNTDMEGNPSWVPDFSKPGISNRNLIARRCFGSQAEAQYAGNGILKATGRGAAEKED
ncbi:MAG: hypothetical protein Q9221_009150 [Calogaya cf. arnoldii]